MGYTHYWRKVNKFTPDFVTRVQTLITHGIEAKVLEPQSSVSMTKISLNGIEDHEDFWVESEKEGFAFCKTARKPYDEYVVAILLLGNNEEMIKNISSDGDMEDWEDGVHLLYDVLSIVPSVPSFLMKSDDPDDE